MSEYQTIARPYAQAVFDLARAGGNYEDWSQALAWVSAIASDERVKELALNPRVDDTEMVTLFDDIAGDRLFDEARNFLQLVVANGRIFILPDILKQFEDKRAEAEGTIEAELISAQQVTDAQRSALAQSLARKLGREVSLRVVEEPDLIGGAILKAGDMVIDASVKGRLQKLTAILAR
ncbi:F0F1 ATP synthase subunit delta [Pseudomonadota bacterium]